MNSDVSCMQSWPTTTLRRTSDEPTSTAARWPARSPGLGMAAARCGDGQLGSTDRPRTDWGCGTGYCSCGARRPLRGWPPQPGGVRRADRSGHASPIPVRSSTAVRRSARPVRARARSRVANRTPSASTPVLVVLAGVDRGDDRDGHCARCALDVVGNVLALHSQPVLATPPAPVGALALGLNTSTASYVRLTLTVARTDLP